MLRKLVSAFAVSLALAACANAGAGMGGKLDPNRTPSTQAAPEPGPGLSVAVFAGGCFWCMESPFEKIDGVKEVLSGYAGGRVEGPSYREVGSGSTQHIEAIHVTYDPKTVSYAELVDHFWHNIDPTQADGQFCDKGHQYTTAIFTSDPAERKVAEETKTKVGKLLQKPIVTAILPEATFWVAEDYHQDFYKKEPVRYNRYRQGCGRDARLEAIWGRAPGH